MNDVVPGAVDEGERRQALATLFRFYELWLAERMPDESRDAVFWQGRKIDYEQLKEVLDGQRKYFISPSPYPGLRSFTPQEARVFFGRPSDVDEVRARLKAHRMVMVLGGSGSGKSSLIRAGVLPYLNSVGRIPGRGGAWYWCEFRPEQSPIGNLASALATNVVIPLVEAVRRRVQTDPAPIEGLAEMGLSLEASPEAIRAWVAAPFEAATTSETLFQALWDFVDTRLGQLDDLAGGGVRAGAPNLLVLLDQLEEVFREPASKGQEAQNAALLGLLARMEEKLSAGDGAAGGLFMAMTMRSEELHRCGEYEGLADIVNRSVFLLELLDPKREGDGAVLHKAIVEPARRVFVSYGIPLEPDNPDSPFAPGVAEWLIQTANKHLKHRPDQLPLLQHALRSMWDSAVRRWKAEDRGEVVPRIEMRDLPGDDPATPYPNLDLCLSHCADAAAAEARGRFQDYKSNKSPKPLSAEEYPAGEAALRATFSALALLDDREHRARRFTTREEIVRHLQNVNTVKRLKDLPKRLERALAPLIFHGYLVGGGQGRPYDISHEALIRNWDRCNKWLDENEAAVDGLREFLRSVDPVEFGKLSENNEIATSVSGVLRAKVAQIGDDQEIPQAWAVDQLRLLLQTMPERRRVWSRDFPTGEPPSREEATAVLDEMRAIALSARAAREAIRVADALREEQERALVQLRRSEEEARTAEVRARQLATEARDAEGQAQQSAKKATLGMRLAAVAAGVAVLALIYASISQGIAQRVLAVSQVETPPSANWSQAVKLGILKKYRPLWFWYGLVGETRNRAEQEAERWDRVARSLIGGTFWLDPKISAAAKPARCWTRGSAGWIANSAAADAALAGFASNKLKVRLIGDGQELGLNIDPRSGAGETQKVSLVGQQALPPLDPGSQVCVSNDASILAVARRESPVPKVFELNLVNCEDHCQVALNEIVPSLAPDRTVAYDKGSLRVSTDLAKQPQGSRVATVRSIETHKKVAASKKDDDRAAIGFVTDYFTGRETSYVATFFGGWATARRTPAPASSVKTNCGDGATNTNSGEITWRCQATPASRHSYEVTLRGQSPRDKSSAPPGQAKLVSMTIKTSGPGFRSSGLRVINVAVPPGVRPLGGGPWDTFLMTDGAGDLWWVRIDQAGLENKIMVQGDSSHLPETVIEAGPKPMQLPTWFNQRGSR